MRVTRLVPTRKRVDLLHTEPKTNLLRRWSHADLTKLSTADATTEMSKLEEAFVNILGYFPYYMRPPYLAYNTAMLSLMSQLEYHVISIDIDTEDWENLTPQTIPNAYNNYMTGVQQGGTISLSHDPLNNTANYLAGKMIDYLNSQGLKCKYNGSPHRH
jgi:peptidoglycan/xylan/chitin deacetylase (PgdA/CDA1 family)